MTRFPERTMTRWWRLCLTLTLCRVQESAWSDCDDGNRRAERDLIPYAMFKCPGPPWSERSQKLPSIDTRFFPEPSLPVCMDSPIIYNKTIPNSGPHRPVGAEYGEYLYCPPQRWIQNLRGGATVFLFHPCVPTAQVSRLSMLARLCLSRYIISLFPQLSTERPLAIVTWGHTLELSHVMPSDVCDWLDLNAPERISGEALEKGKYRLLLRRAAEPSELRRGSQEGTWQEALRRCCVEAFSLPLEEGPRIGRERRRMKRRGRIESIMKDGKEAGLEKRGGDGGSAVQQSAHWGSLTEPSAGAGNVTHGPESHSVPGEEQGPGSRESGRVAQGGQQGGRPQGQPGPPGTQAAEESQARGARSQEGRRDPGRTSGKEQAQTEPLTPADASQAKGRGSRPECGGLEVEAVRARQGLRVPTPRTDEAAWAAAALGFLLLLLTLSVLHTRLYRNWRSPPSLYWPHPEQEYDSVADVIRRRLKLLGQRKRRGTGGRRQEYVLLPSSSSEDSD